MLFLVYFIRSQNEDLGFSDGEIKFLSLAVEKKKKRSILLRKGKLNRS